MPIRGRKEEGKEGEKRERGAGKDFQYETV